MQPALLGGLFIGVLSALPIINVANCCCLWIVGGGALAAYLTQQEDPRPITPGGGALAGLAAGVAGAIIWVLVAIPIDILIAPIQERMVSQMMASSADMPPEVRASRAAKCPEWPRIFGGRNESARAQRHNP